ncbi:MAG: DUF5110 domain-containing protein [Clostridia bacterium]|nr:DUF5110 domain-containing protein [Clostridia bacterium]
MDSFTPNPMANKEAIVQGKDFRFTILTDRLFRIEYEKNGRFEDRATQTVVNRQFPVPEYSVTKKDKTTIIRTDCVQIIYHGGVFSKNSLQFSFCGRLGKFPTAWYFGDEPRTLPGTLRTLDVVSGKKELPNSIMNRGTFALMDDSKSLAIGADNWPEERTDNCIDMYIFAYPKDYKACLDAYYTLTGKTPMLPRFALGNWWSRYFKYSDTEYINLIEKFEEEGIPISVAAIDMDWHKVDIDTKYGSGWTGFSWNRDLFKNPKDFLDTLHKRQIKTSLNLHPAEGISAHEDCYEAAAESMNADNQNEEKILFDIADRAFVKTYFDKVLKSLEEDGVDFWWMDWQSGNASKMKDLDPLWMLNHLHFQAASQNNNRGLLLSRFSGYGSHRYPVGFSGDVIINWESLDFQPYFTACASNVGYGWWSHDIGGHMGGIHDDELMNRWTQYGAFSPVLRLHCCQNPFITHEPWAFNDETRQSMKKFMRLRHEMLPYLYTMNFRAHNDNIPLVTPIYYEYPDIQDAYRANNQYFFGSELIVCPITQRKDEVTQMGSSMMYLPEGTWFDFFNKYKYDGNRKIMMYRKYDEMPVLAKAGAIIPTASIKGNSVANPEEIILNIFPGADNTFTLYEDDGETRDYENGKYLKTKISLNWQNKTITIAAPEGDMNLIPENRSYRILLHCVDNCKATASRSIKKSYRDGAIEIKADGTEELSITFAKTLAITENNYAKKVYDILFAAHTSYDDKQKIYDIIEQKSVKEAIADIYAMGIDENLKNALLEALL